jgi:SAM-dependent methyltransferase
MLMTRMTKEEKSAMSTNPFDNAAPQAGPRIASLETKNDPRTIRHLEAARAEVDTAEPERYLLGHSLAEQQRLQQQSQELASEARWLLDQLQIQPGARAIDLGCGPQGVLDLLAERVGPRGSVLGVDMSAHAVQLATAFAVDHHLSSVEVRLGTARDTGLPRASFDVAHARLVLVNVPEPERIVAEMVALVRPGGVVALHEADWMAHFCEPPSPAWSRLMLVMDAHARAQGIDLYIGRRVPALLRAAGLVDIQAHPVIHVYPPGHSRRPIFLRFVLNMREQILAQGLLSAAEMDDLTASLQAHLDDPETLVVSHLFFQVWGRRPEC